MACWAIDVNPGGWGSRSPDLGMGVVGFPLNTIISYNAQEYETKTLSKVVSFQKYKNLWVLNNNSENDTLNPVQRDFVC